MQDALRLHVYLVRARTNDHDDGLWSNAFESDSQLIETTSLVLSTAVSIFIDARLGVLQL
jgi:hypothetical protein